MKVNFSLQTVPHSPRDALLCAWLWVLAADFSVAQAQVPEILAQPTNQVVLGGNTATFSVAASGPGPLTYRWQFNGANLPYGVISTVAGNGTAGYSGDGAAATEAELFYPLGVAVGATGSLFIPDFLNQRIRKVGANGIITTVAGTGMAGYSGDGGEKVIGPTKQARDGSVGYAADRSRVRISPGSPAVIHIVADHIRIGAGNPAQRDALSLGGCRKK